MERRKFLIGAGGTAVGASALVGSGAFSRVESQRHVTVEVAEDPDAYLGLDASDSPNGQNFASIDGNGHLEISIGDIGDDDDPRAEGVNSNSTTWFDCVFTVRNQGKAEADFYIEDMGGLGEDEGEIDFYTGEASGSTGDEDIDSVVGDDNSRSLTEGGDEICVGVRVNSAEDQEAPLFEDNVTLIADSPDAGAQDD